jgi:hypothetical protein
LPIFAKKAVTDSRAILLNVSTQKFKFAYKLVKIENFDLALQKEAGKIQQEYVISAG